MKSAPDPPASAIPLDGGSLTLLVRSVHQATSAALRPVFADEGVTSSQWHALAFIDRQHGSTASALSRDLGYDPGAMTRLLDGMEARRWVSRERDRVDRRSVRLALTAEGRETMARVRPRLAAVWNAWLADWTPREVEEAIGMLQRLRNQLEDRTGAKGAPCACGKRPG